MACSPLRARRLHARRLHSRCTAPGASEPFEDTALCNTAADCEAGFTCVYYEAGPNSGALSYDDVVHAWATIFQAVTLEGWVDQMYMLEKTASPAATIIFYILIVIVGSQFIVNLFLAVLFDAFASGAENDLAIEEAAKAEEAAKGPPQLYRRKTNLHVRGATARTDNLIYVLIGLNTIFMCANYYGESEEYARVLDVMNTTFTFVFVVEMAFKLCAWGATEYFTSNWNRFDFFVTWCSMIDLGLEQFGRDTDFLRALRVARVMRLLKLNPKLARFERTFAAVASLVTNLSLVLVCSCPPLVPAAIPHATPRLLPSSIAPCLVCACVCTSTSTYHSHDHNMFGLAGMSQQTDSKHDFGSSAGVDVKEVTVPSRQQ